MSTNNLGKLLASWLFLIIFLSLLFSFFRQVFTYKRISKRISEEEQELQTLKKRNIELKNKLEEVKDQDLENHSSLGSGTQEQTSVGNIQVIREEKKDIPNYQKWWNLFFTGQG